MKGNQIMSIFKFIGCLIRREFRQIHLIDKCLIVIMLLLLIQSAHSLTANVASHAQVNTIDVIIRTATASIFGYFLSSNFINHHSSDRKKIMKKDKAELKIQEKGILPDPLPDPEYTVDADNHLQIIITTIIAVFCLLVLITVRNAAGFSEENLTPSSLATVSQFRDLVSGCVGFLIGVPTSKKN